jgi:uncharacterized protein (TIGR02271 family)
MSTTVVGLFDHRDAAERSVEDLVNAGFDRSRVSVVAADPEGKLYKQHIDEHGNMASEGAATGLTSGAVIGGLLGLLVGAGIIFVPAGVVAAGPIAGLIAGGAAGAAAGGILGGLIGLGIPEDHAETYAEGVRRGGTLVTVQADDAMVNRAHDILNRDGAVDIEDRAATWRAEGFTAYNPKAPVYTEEQQIAERSRYAATPPAALTTDTGVTGASRAADQTLREGDKLEVIKEDLSVGKKEVEQGGVRVRSYVTEQPVSEQVNLREEKVEVERRPVDRPATPADIAAFKEGTLEMKERAEVPVVSKEARVVEEVGLNKRVEERTQTVSDTVRETHVEVEPLPFDETWSRSDWQSRYGTSGAGTWESYRPAYVWGSRMASDARYRGREFSGVERDLQSEYERQYPGQWSAHRSAIESSFNRSRSDVGLGSRAYADNPTPTGVPNDQPGIQTGGRNADGSADTRGITEKIADAVTGDKIDDKTGKRI